MHGRLGMGLMLQNIAYLKEGVGFQSRYFKYYCETFLMV